MAQQRRLITAAGWLLGLVMLTALACNVPAEPPVQPTRTPRPQFCLPFSADLALPVRPTDPDDYPAVLRDFLNAGGSPEALVALLRSWGAVDDEIGGMVDPSRDLNADGLLDVLVTLHYPLTAAAPQPAGQLLIFGCDLTTGRYETLYTFAAAPDSGRHMPRLNYVAQEDLPGAPIATNAIGDITLDGLPEIIFWVEECPGLACFREPIILTWNPAEATFIPLSDPFAVMYTYKDDTGRPIRGLPNAGVQLVAAGEGRPLTVIVEENDPFVGMEGEARPRGYGPFRPVQHVWTWRGDRYAYTAANPGPSTSYIHLLREADQLLRVGNYEDAILRYQAALDPARSSTWGGIVETEQNHADERARLDAYAGYRLVLAHSGARDGRAAALVEQLQRDRPWQLADIPSYYTLLASTFYNQLQAVGGGTTYENALSLACQEVQRLAGREPYAVTAQFLGDANYFGPWLADYTLTDLCPF